MGPESGRVLHGHVKFGKPASRFLYFDCRDARRVRGTGRETAVVSLVCVFFKPAYLPALTQRCCVCFDDCPLHLQPNVLISIARL